MKIISIKCPNCGSQLQIDEKLTNCYCTFCGTHLIIDPEIQEHKVTLENGFEFGYQQELGRQKAEEEREEKLLKEYEEARKEAIKRQNEINAKSARNWAIAIVLWFILGTLAYFTKRNLSGIYDYITCLIWGPIIFFI